MSDAVIQSSHLGKRYQLGGALWAPTLRETLTSWITGRGRRERARRSSTIWALRDVSFDVHAGEVLGVIGHNGAGKSTLLKILSRITEPTEGEVRLQGRVGSVLDVGMGFQFDLTGRENVYLSGAILGMGRAEITRKFDEIVSFAGTEAFLDTPVKHYSSGMYLRLAFAVAAHLEPDTLVIDEVLATGDAAFQKKCLGRMGDMARQGRTVLFVSHNLGAVRLLCTRAIVLGSGVVQFDGAPGEAIAHYLANVTAGAEKESHISFAPDGLEFEGLTLYAVRVVDETGAGRAIFDAADPVRVELEYEVKAVLYGTRTVLTISTQEGELAFQSTDHIAREGEQRPGRYKTTCTIPGGLLNHRIYVAELTVEIPDEKVLAPRRPYVSFAVSGGTSHGSTYPEAWPGVVCPSLSWRTERG
jgi:lipopolysaccharide transport system ATP-binding protein